jgi:uroporphyrinogen-III decarboxylase
MAAAESRKKAPKREATVIPAVAPEAHKQTPAWEMIEAGRYMPRRIRGSYLGRELG